MNDRHITKIARELTLNARQVRATAELLEQDATVPFIARYRKEATGSLDEVAITTIRDRVEQLAELDKRREAILESLTERELLTDELSAQIDAAETMAELEDIYLPYRPKRRTRATIAREKGLEPLAQLLMLQNAKTDPSAEAAAFVNEEAGRRVGRMRRWPARATSSPRSSARTSRPARGCASCSRVNGAISSSVVKDKQEEGAKFKDYFDWTRAARRRRRRTACSR